MRSAFTTALVSVLLAAAAPVHADVLPPASAVLAIDPAATTTAAPLDIVGRDGVRTLLGILDPTHHTFSPAGLAAEIKRAGDAEAALAAKLAHSVYLTDYGAVAGGADIGPALTAAEAALPQGGTVVVPAAAGCYNLQAPHVMSRLPNGANLDAIEIRGDGAGSCIATNFDGDSFVIGDANHAPANVSIRHLSIRAITQKTAGAQIRIGPSRGALVSDVVLSGLNYSDIDVVDATSPHVTNVKDEDKGYAGIRAGLASANQVYDLVMDGYLLFNQKSRAAVELTSVGGGTLHNLDGIVNEHAVQIDPADGQAVTGMNFSNNTLDTSLDEGLLIAPTGTGRFEDSIFTALWTASSGYRPGSTASGIRIEGTPNTVRSILFVGLRSFNNAGDGISLNGGAFIDFWGAQVGFNSKSNPNYYNGLTVAPGVSHWSFHGRSGAGTEFLQTNPQGYGVTVSAGPSDYYTVEGDFSGNTTGGVADLGTGTHKTVLDPDGRNVFTSTNFPTTFAGVSRQSTAANAGQGSLAWTAGTGQQSDAQAIGGCVAGVRCWLQAVKPGLGNLPLDINPNGGAVRVGPDGFSTTGQITGAALVASGSVYGTGNVATGGHFNGPLQTPASSSAACTPGDSEDDASYHYVCTGANHWRRAALSDF